MIERNIMIINKLGLHARAASRLVTRASSFEAQIWLSRDDREVNGKSIMGVLTLAAARGTTLLIRADGNDEKEAMEAIENLINNKFEEDE
jgi:phosphocarrier protein HPr